MTDVVTDDIGTLIKRRREKLGYSLENVSEKIRIRKIYLEHIEANNFADLPGKAYVKGFIDVYSRFLGLDSKELLATLATLESQDASPADSAPIPQKIDKQLSTAPAAKGWGTFLWVFLIVMAVGLAFFFLPDFLDDEVPVSVEAPAAKKQVVAPVANTVELGAPVVEKGQVQDAEPAKESESAVEDVVQAVAVKKEPLPAIRPQGSSLRMLALAEGSLIITVDKRKPHQYALHDGLDLTWKIKSNVNVALKSAGIARFWLDGVELDTAELKSFMMKPSSEE